MLETPRKRHLLPFLSLLSLTLTPVFFVSFFLNCSAVSLMPISRLSKTVRRDQQIWPLCSFTTKTHSPPSVKRTLQPLPLAANLRPNRTHRRLLGDGSPSPGDTSEARTGRGWARGGRAARGWEQGKGVPRFGKASRNSQDCFSLAFFYFWRKLRPLFRVPQQYARASIPTNAGSRQSVPALPGDPHRGWLLEFQ